MASRELAATEICTDVGMALGAGDDIGVVARRRVTHEGSESKADDDIAVATIRDGTHVGIESDAGDDIGVVAKRHDIGVVAGRRATRVGSERDERSAVTSAQQAGARA